jgi:hypothetical protein
VIVPASIEIRFMGPLAPACVVVPPVPDAPGIAVGEVAAPGVAADEFGDPGAPEPAADGLAALDAGAEELGDPDGDEGAPDGLSTGARFSALSVDRLQLEAN